MDWKISGCKSEAMSPLIRIWVLVLVLVPVLVLVRVGVLVRIRAYETRQLKLLSVLSSFWWANLTDRGYGKNEQEREKRSRKKKMWE